MAEEKTFTSDQSEKQYEDQIYDGFPSSKDNYIMKEFHAAEKEKKYDISKKITDIRIKEFAKRVIYNTSPEQLPKNVIKEHEKDIAEKLLNNEKCVWKTIPDAMAEIDNLRADEERDDLELINEYDEYIQELWEKYKDLQENK